jgi:hypothetical protein
MKKQANIISVLLLRFKVVFNDLANAAAWVQRR